MIMLMKHYVNDDTPYCKEIEASDEAKLAVANIIFDLFQETQDVTATRHKFEDLCISAAYDWECSLTCQGLGGGPTADEVLNRPGGEFMLLKEFIEAGFVRQEFLLFAHDVACDCCFALYEWKE
jgi:hypothetical protein